MIIYFLSCIKPNYVIPDLEVRDVNDVDLEDLTQRGIKGIILDVDNTIAMHNRSSLDSKVMEKIREIQRRFRTSVVSNNRLHSIEEYEKCFGTYVVRSKKPKPMPEPFYEALEHMQTKPHETAMIGDKLIADIAGAKRLGLFTIKVEPLGSYPILQILLNGFEKVILNHYKSRLRN